MRNKWIMLAVAVVASAGAGGLTGQLNARPAVGVELCSDAATRHGLKAAILARVVERGGDADDGFALSLDTPRLISADAGTGQTVCGGVVRLAVPQARRSELDGVSELSDTVRYSVQSGGARGLTRVALIDGGEVMTDWLGAPPTPPAPPSAALLRALSRPFPDPTPVPMPAPRVSAPDVVRVSAPTAQTLAASPAPRPAARSTTAPRTTPTRAPSRTPTRPTTVRAAPAPVRTPPVPTRQPTPPVSARVVATAPVIQASFDCRRAATQTERTICGDASLAGLDLRMAQTFARMRNNTDGKTSLVLHDQQRAWLRQRDTCRTRDCLTSMYQIRIRALDQFG